MITMKQFLTEKDEDFNAWISSLNIPKRKPRSINKTEHDVMLGLFDLVQQYNSTIFPKEKKFLEASIKVRKSYLRLSKEELNQVYGSNTQKNIIKKPIGTYIKFDTSSYKNFLNNVDTVENFLKTLKGYHKKALKNVKIKFVSSSDMKSAAKYRGSEDLLMINVSKMGNTKEEYGSLPYVVLHELGHRYEKYNPQKWNTDSQEWITTKYSMVDTFTGGEKFPELFALSNWKSKYPEYKDIISKFEREIQ